MDVAKYLGLNPRVTSTVRSTREQRRLYNRYLAGQSRFPAARPGTSLHERGRAIDLVTTDNALLAQYWKYYVGGRWLGAKDWVHYDL